VGSFYLLNNYILTGDPAASLYEFVWDFDKIGFGADVGAGDAGHYPADAVEKIKGGLYCYNRDLFGWVLQPDNPPDQLYPIGDMCVTDRAGISWILLPFGVL